LVFGGSVPIHSGFAEVNQVPLIGYQLAGNIHTLRRSDDLLRLGLHRLPIGEFPLLRSLAPALASYNGAAELERGLDILLTGLLSTLTPPVLPGTATRTAS
jgi:hypothetical protein